MQLELIHSFSCDVENFLILLVRHRLVEVLAIYHSQDQRRNLWANYAEKPSVLEIFSVEECVIENRIFRENMIALLNKRVNGCGSVADDHYDSENAPYGVHHSCFDFGNDGEIRVWVGYGCESGEQVHLHLVVPP